MGLGRIDWDDFCGGFRVGMIVHEIPRAAAPNTPGYRGLQGSSPGRI
jgi:hypothetical protein